VTKPEALDVIHAVTAGVAGFLAFMAVVLLAFTLVGMVRR
jgi:hypothetical protein